MPCCLDRLPSLSTTPAEQTRSGEPCHSTQDEARLASEHGNFWLPRELQPRLNLGHARWRIQVIARTGLVLLECPTTGLQFNAGIRSDTEGLAALVDRGMQTTCPHCNERHGLAHAMLDIDLAETPRMPGLPVRTSRAANAQTTAAQPTTNGQLYTGM